MNTSRKIHYDVWISLGLFAFIGFVYYETTLFKQADKTAVYPRILLGVLAALTIILLIGGIRKSTPTNDEKIKWGDMKMSLISAAIITVYELVFITLGYFVATPLFLLSLFTYLKQRNWKIMIAVIAVYLILVYLIFVMLLKVKLV